MTTILDNIKTPDVVTPVNRGSLDVEDEAKGSTKFSEVIERANIKNVTDNDEQNLVKSATNDENLAVVPESNELDKAIEKTVTAVNIVNLLPEAQAKVELEAVKGYAPTESKNLQNTPGIKLQTQLTINTGGNSESGNKLPGEGQIQPVPPSQSLASNQPLQLLAEGFEFKNQQVQKELESTVETTKIVNLNPVKSPRSEAHIPLTPVEIQGVVIKGPKQTIQPIDVGNVTVQNQTESPLLKVVTDSLNPPQQTQPQPLQPNNAVANAEGLPNKDHSVVDKFQGEIQQFIEGEVKIKRNGLLTSMVKTDALMEPLKVTNNNNSNSQSPQINAINTVSMTPIQSSNNINEAKLTTMTMQTSYSAGNKEWSENFARNIALMTVSKNNMAEIRMDPPELGAIQVKISHTGNETNLQFQVNHNDTKQAIEASIQRLKESLAEQGFSNVNVDIQHGEQSPNNSQHSSQNLVRSDPANDESLLQHQTSMLQLQQLPSSGVDFFA